MKRGSAHVVGEGGAPMETDTTTNVSLPPTQTQPTAQQRQQRVQQEQELAQQQQFQQWEQQEQQRQQQLAQQQQLQMPGTEGSMLDMLSRLLDTKLDDKLGPLSTEVHTMRTQMEALTGDMETISSKVESLEYHSEEGQEYDGLGEHGAELGDDSHADRLSITATGEPTPQEAAEATVVRGHGYSLRTRTHERGYTPYALRETS